MRLCPSITCSLLVVAVWGNIGVARAGIPGLFDLITPSIALFDDFFLLLQVLLGHLVQVEAVDLGVMGRCALLQGVDRTCVESVLNEAEGGAPE